MFDIELTQESLTLFGILFGLLMIAPAICGVFTEATRPTDTTKPEDEEND